MVGAVLYGVYSLFIEPRLKKAKAPAASKNKAQIEEFVGQVTQSIAGKAQSKGGAYTLSQAEADWEKDPFLKSEVDFNAPKDEKPANLANLTYSGFLKMGKRDMAIINGMEYEVGEELEEPGYTIKKITPTKVVLDVAERKKDLVLLLTENE